MHNWCPITSAHYQHSGCLKTSIHDWADFFSPEISMLLCFPLVNELFLYIYLSQLMRTFTKLSKSALSSRWFLFPEGQETVIQQSHMYI